MKFAPHYAAILAELDKDKWVCIKCIIQKVYVPGEHRPTVTTRVYNRIKKLISDGAVVYSSSESCRNPMCKSEFHVMVHKLTEKGAALKK